MKLNKVMFWITAGVSLFLGLTIGVALIGAVVTPVHKLTGALVCGGTVEIKETTFTNGPKSSYSDIDVLCTTGGNTLDITNQSFVILGLISTLLFFAAAVYFMRGLIFQSGTSNAQEKLKSVDKEKKNDQSGLERMSELKKMRDDNLISQAEFERKKSEIMDEL
ncbi:MAG TPA: SHOCT domain-containing protein [Anaerolineales bacterium]|nr:SHOCT domain-containing protein [Anaerolineales bacterium]